MYSNHWVMSCKQKTYKRLGDYIREVDVRNKENRLSENDLYGVSVTKEYIPTHANLVGVQFHNYKVVKTKQFTYIPDTSRRGDKIALALNLLGKEIIVSNVYITFEVDEKRLLPEYLMMWFRRPEFDRYARYKSHGSAREVFDWEDMCDVLLPVPPIEEQRRIVSEYQTVERRIQNNEQLIKKLEETAQAIYHHTFVEGIDENNLPEGWNVVTIREFCSDIKSGGTPSKLEDSYWSNGVIPWIKTGEVQNCVIIESEEFITEEGLKNSSARLIPRNSVVVAMYGGGTLSNVGYLAFETSTNQACCNMMCKTKLDASYLYYYFRYRQEEIRRLANGGAQENLNAELLSSQKIFSVDNVNLLLPFKVILDNVINLTYESKHLRSLLSLLTSKLS